jgi:preprotein translocase subunit Sss1
MLQNVEALGIIFLGMLIVVPVMFAGNYRRYHGHWPNRDRWLFFIKITLAILVVSGVVGWIIGKYTK